MTVNTVNGHAARRRQRRLAHGWQGIAGWAVATLLALPLPVPPLLVQPAAAQTPQAAAGTSAETAIVLPNIADEFHGVAAEHAYIAAHFADWHIEYQATAEHDGHRYDLLGMVEPDGTKTVLYFDVTGWFGK